MVFVNCCGIVKEEFNKIKDSFFISLIFVAIMTAILSFEAVFSIDLGGYGVYPRTVSGLKGILFSPFLHGDFTHLFNNSIPLLVLGTLLFYFYRKISWEVATIIWLVSGLWLWIIGRPSYHIGASSFVYGLAAFLFFSGLIRRNASLLTISLLVVFLYGSLIWGIFPIEEHISWEGHLSGAIAGTVVAWFYRKHGAVVKPKEIILEEPDDSDPYWLVDEEDDDIVEQAPRKPIKIYRYYFRKNDEGDTI
jgi:membrane associated rhomboid family serine protease